MSTESLFVESSYLIARPPHALTRSHTIPTTRPPSPPPRIQGEGSIDAGGPFRDCISHLCAELQPKQEEAAEDVAGALPGSVRFILPLLRPSANAGFAISSAVSSGHLIAAEKGGWTLNPGASSRLELSMFAFLGKLQGYRYISCESCSPFDLLPLTYSSSRRVISHRQVS